MIRKKKLESPPDGSMILASGVYLPTDKGRCILVFGGAGSGKHFYYAGPNLMQCSGSYVVTDPSGSLYRQYGKFLEGKGYKVKSLNLSQMDKGNRYNPFHYIRGDEDIESLVDTLFANTAPSERFKNVPSGREAESSLLKAVVAYLHAYADPAEQNFTNIMKLLREAWGRGEPLEKKTALDYIFDNIRTFAPDSYAVRQYDNFRTKAGDSPVEAVISCLTRLQVFDLWDVAELTKTDDIGLEAVGSEKTVLFIITPTSELTFHFLAAVIYAQMFDIITGHREEPLVHTHLLMDQPEMALVPELRSRIDAAKKRGATTTMFVHTPETMVKNYRDDWEPISGNCDAAILISQGGRGICDWFQKHAGMTTQRADKTEKKRSFRFFHLKNASDNTDACLEDIRSLPEDECLVAVKGMPVKKVPKYAAKDHPSWKIFKGEMS